jgi:general secretion pathway protein A
MNTFLEDSLEADLELLKQTEKANKAILAHFDLLEHPYRGGPDFRFLYTTDQVKEAIAKCILLTVERVNPVYMYGPFGTGKSTIIRRLYALLRRDKRFNVKFIILHDRVSGNSLLRDILDAFGVKPARSYDLSLKRFQRYLIGELTEEEYKADKEGKKDYYDATKIPVLLLDEGQHLQKDALRLIHSLLNFETPSYKRLQIVIAGQEGLAKNILGMGELASRMKGIAIYHMSAPELEKMLKYRWVVAGGKEEDLPFPNDRSAYQVLFEYTKGLPRDVIKVADDVLRHLMAHNKKQITIAEIEAIIQENNLIKAPINS